MLWTPLTPYKQCMDRTKLLRFQSSQVHCICLQKCGELGIYPNRFSMVGSICTKFSSPSPEQYFDLSSTVWMSLSSLHIGINSIADFHINYSKWRWVWLLTLRTSLCPIWWMLGFLFLRMAGLKLYPVTNCHTPLRCRMSLQHRENLWMNSSLLLGLSGLNADVLKCFCSLPVLRNCSEWTLYALLPQQWVLHSHNSN